MDLSADSAMSVSMSLHLLSLLHCGGFLPQAHRVCFTSAPALSLRAPCLPGSPLHLLAEKLCGTMCTFATVPKHDPFAAQFRAQKVFRPDLYRMGEPEFPYKNLSSALMPGGPLESVPGWTTAGAVTVFQ